MKNKYICLNSKTFEIEERNDIIPVDEQLAKTISILNQKGYYTEMFSKAKIKNPFMIGALIHDLLEQELLDINDNTKDKVKDIIKKSDYEATIVIFKEKYKFNSLPNGYKLIGKDLNYNLSTLENSDDIKFKSLVELDYELNKSIKGLEEWTNKLPSIK